MGRYVFKLPDVGEGTAEAEIVAWHVKLGEMVEEDAPLADVMTDKATIEITAPVSGRIVERNGEPGEMAPIGSVLVVFETDGADAGPPAPPPAKSAAKEAPAPKQAAPAPVARPVAGEGAGGPARQQPDAFATRESPDDKPLASPAVRKRAHELGVHLQFVAGSGPAGRIEHEDLDAYVANGGGGGRSSGGGALYAQREGAEDIKVIGLRRKIAEKMQDAKRRIPHFAYVEEVDMTELEALRAHLNATRRKDQPKLTLLPFLVRALVRLLPDYPQINATFDDEAGVVHRHHAVHCGIAAQTANGLVVPVVKHAEAMDVWALATEIARLAEATKNGKATRDELSGSTITITSLGPLGGVVTTPVINHPEVAIIGPNKIIERPVVQNGVIVVRKMMNISSSFDHRVVDGYDAAEFIQRVKALLEHPATIFMD
ncbi:MAG: 2-oxoisovalerate dehydrogenase E2 component (dihydrolipoyl transacylase) [Caulobacteraceae bacterium]|nr:MAG: 2-oxoisovalerate dehydrogenase E2 component (dihydrolipoyl transacylase) [Caulobacteraceae bacterium]